MKRFTLKTFSETDEIVADAAASPWSMAIAAAQHCVAEGGAGLDILLDAAAASAVAILPGASGALVALRSGGRLLCRAARGSAASLLGSVLPADPLSAHCLADARLVHCEDSEHDGRVDKLACRRLGIRAIILVPIPYRGEIAGLLAVHAELPNAFDASERLAAQLLAGPIALGLAAAPEPTTGPSDPRLAAGFEAAPVGIAMVSPAGAFLAANPRFCLLAGRGRAETLASPLRQLVDPEDLDAQADRIDAMLDGTLADFAVETRWLRPDGVPAPVRLAVSLVRDAAGAPDCLLLIAEDPAGDGSAPYDSITGLLNSNGLGDRLERELDRAANDGRPLTLALLDLDGFASVEASGQGEACLQAVGRALGRACRPGDAVARIRGGTFALVMPGLERGAAASPLRRARSSVARLARRNGWPIDSSLGAASRLRDGASPESLILAAETRLRVTRARRG